MLPALLAIARAQAPTITALSAPRQTVALGQSLTLTVAASGTGPLSYQWKHNGVSIAGATATSYTLTNAQPVSHNGWYQVVVSNGSGSTPSAAIFVNVTLSVSQVVCWGQNFSGQTTVPAGLTNVTSVSAGSSYTAALRSDGTVTTWGSLSTFVPMPTGLNNVVMIAAGQSHLLALRSDGTVVAWGNNGTGETDVPPSLSNVVSIAAGFSHSLALRADGTVVAWGANNYGQASVPAGLPYVSAIAAGGLHSYAVKIDGTLAGWGLNDNGQTAVPAITNIQSVSGGGYFGLALYAPNTVIGWGSNTFGQLTIPAGLNNAVAVAAGVFHSAALKADGTVAVWSSYDSTITAIPAGLAKVVLLACGQYHVAALRDASTDTPPAITSHPASTTAYTGQDVTFSVAATSSSSILNYQWRRNTTPISGGTNATLKLPRVGTADAGNYDVLVSNQFGTTTSLTAVLSVNAAAAATLNQTGFQSLTGGQTYVLTSSSPLTGPLTYEWRRNGRTIAGATGANYTIANASARDVGMYQVIVTNAVGPAGSGLAAVSVAMPTQVVSWGTTTSVTTVPTGIGNVIGVAGGSSHSLALKSDGTIVGWGNNFLGQISVPSNLGPVIAVAASASYSMALKADGTVALWGSMGAPPSGLSNVVAIAAGGNYAMALKSDGTVSAWTSSGIATDVPSTLATVVGVAAGGNHRLAVKADGSVIAWGDGSFGQTSVPSGLSGVIAVAAGNTHSLALKSDGTVVAWGNTSSGQTFVPSGLANCTAIAGSSFGSVALRTDGGVATWGANITTVPIGLVPLFAIAAGDNHVVALRDGTGDVAPAITTQPVSQSVNAGPPVSFSVVATGQPAPTYQWRKNGFTFLGTNASGQTTSTLIFGAPQASDAGTYDVVVSNYLGSVTSTAVTLTVAGPPVFTSSPSAPSVADGQNATMSVSVAANPPATLQWRKDGVDIPNATNSSLVFLPAHYADQGTYTVVATNVYGSVTSFSSTLVIIGPPAIVTQPAGGSVALGGATQLSVTAAGSLPLGYQWRKNNVDLAGANGPTLRLFGIQASDAGDYTVFVANNLGSTVSAVATLTVGTGTPPVILTQPRGGPLNVSNVLAFNVVAASSNSLFYQWRKDGTPIFGATGATYVVGQATTAFAGNYDVVVASPGGSVTSSAAAVTINSPAPVFTLQPQGAVLGAGTPVTLSVTVTGVPTPTLQWRKNGVALTGVTTTSLSFTAVQAGDSGNYDVVATNSVGSVTSSVATLTVLAAAPTILVDPVGGTVFVGSGITLSVTAVGAPALQYQWRRGGVNLPGATSPSLGIPNPQTYDTGDYDVVVRNSFGSFSSAVAHLTVVPRLLALSARVMIGSGESADAAFTVEGTAAKTLLLRVVGPGITPFGYTNVVTDPQLEVFDSAGNLIAVNNDWSSGSNAGAIATATAAVGAFALNVGSRDSAVLQTFAPGAYLARGKGVTGTGGLAFLELYDADATPTGSRVPFAAVRGRVAPGDAIMVGGMGSNGRAVRSFLIRAAGPALGLASAFPNPLLTVAREGNLVGGNDDWDAVASDGTAVTTATTRVAAFALPAGSRDAATVITGNLHASAHTVQVAGVTGSGLVLLELHDLDPTRPTTFAPVVVSSPVSQAVVTGGALALTARANGTAPLAYQWRKDSVNLPGATDQSYTVASAQLADGGAYAVAVTNSLGTAVSLPAIVTVGGTSGTSSASQVLNGSSYQPGGTVTITTTLTFPADTTTLAWSVVLPAGWSFVSDSGFSGQLRPGAGAVGTLGWAWYDAPTSPVTFSYTVAVPASESVPRSITASLIVAGSTSSQTVNATPNPLTIAPLPAFHSADRDHNLAIDLPELTRVIQLYNTRNAGLRTGAYKVDPTGEDGFNPDPARANGAPVVLATYHTADTTARDGKLNLTELTRVIELYNYRQGTVRTGQYHVQAGTEDGFAAGP